MSIEDLRGNVEEYIMIMKTLGNVLTSQETFVLWRDTRIEICHSIPERWKGEIQPWQGFDSVSTKRCMVQIESYVKELGVKHELNTTCMARALVVAYAS